MTCVPLVPLQAAAGRFGEADTIPDDDAEWEWVELDTARSLRRGMFVARVDGKSMEPRIPDGSYCLFAGPVTGSRQGRTVLARLLNAVDPDTGQRFTVKRYRSEKAVNDDGWRHQAIVLEPLNPDYAPLELTAEDESPVAVIAELLEVIGTDAPADAGAADESAHRAYSWTRPPGSLSGGMGECQSWPGRSKSPEAAAGPQLPAG